MPGLSLFLFAPAESALPHSGPVAYAIALAKAHSANLTLFCVNLDVTTPGRQTDPVDAIAAIQAAAREAGIDLVTITEHSHAIGIPDVIAEHARNHDLTVMGCSADGLLSERILVERLLFDSGRPLIVVPSDYCAGSASQTVAVAWDNTAAAARALGDAKPFILNHDIYFLTIDGDKQMRGDMSSEAVRVAAARRGLNVRMAGVQKGNRDIAEALQAEAQTVGADLLVMGGYGHSTFRNIVMGSATSGILHSLHMPVLLSH